MSDKVIILRSSSDLEINILKSKLDDAGIPNWIINKKDSSYMTFGEIELYVDNSDVEKAKTLFS